MFFRKKRDGEPEGYDRIARMVEDGGEEDLFDEDTVLLTRDPVEPAPAATTAGAASPATPGRDTAGHEMLAAAGDEIQESVTVVRAPQAGVAPPRESPPPTPEAAPLTPPSTVAATVAAPLSAFAPSAYEAPRMAVPDLPAASGQGTASLVAKDAVWEGKLVCSGNVRVEGTLKGDIQTDGTLFVAADAQVDGTVRARNVTLAGDIKGDLHCEERLEILPGGAARGDVNTGALVVHEGAFIDSRFQMRRELAASR